MCKPGSHGTGVLSLGGREGLEFTKDVREKKERFLVEGEGVLHDGGVGIEVELIIAEATLGRQGRHLWFAQYP